ncbi:uncharacterized protein LOC135085494 [Ostrinia nubilalis]|uniref:uncharacterized protein LOC135085494 n=1 Tax=Ostrinia nubilalis TaxID=29057 RepID=UPI0030826644
MYTYGAGSSSDRPYHGFPYLNSVVNDVPTIDAETSARWNKLPRRADVLSGGETQPGGSDGSGQTNTVEGEETPEPTTEELAKVDYDANPVVYIDVPESSGSQVAEQRRPPVEESFVQQTIFYDQFKDQVVTVPEPGSSSSSTSSGSTSRPVRRAPPITLSLGSPESGFSSQGNTPGAPAIMAKEVGIYGRYQTDSLYGQARPEVREFPNPPPAYTEIDTLSASTPTAAAQTPPTSSPVSTAEEAPEQPRTQVIVPLAQETKNPTMIYCKHCDVTAPSFSIMQVGFATHMLALTLILFALFPLLILLYCFDYFRYRNHYCKFCNKLVAYEIPFLCKGLTYND